MLQGQADESRTVVGQWKEAYEKLTSQYEEMQVGFLRLLSCLQMVVIPSQDTQTSLSTMVTAIHHDVYFDPVHGRRDFKGV